MKLKFVKTAILVLAQSLTLTALADRDASVCYGKSGVQLSNCCEDQFRFDYSDSADENIAHCKGEDSYKRSDGGDNDVEERVRSALAATFASDEQCHTDDLLDDAAFRSFGGCKRIDRENGRCELAKSVKGYGPVITICFGG